MNKKTAWVFRYLLLPVMLLFLAHSCARAPRFTFTGISLSPDIKTFSVENFFNDALDGPADMGIRFTESLREYYQRNTPLRQITSAGDLQFSGRITRYDVRPVAAGAQETQGAQLQRLSITVSVDYINIYEDEKSFQNSAFSFFEDFPANRNLADVENDLIRNIFEQIIFDIFNKTVADW